MVHDNHERFFDCYRDYTSCLGDDYIHPNLKGEVFTYISSMKSLPNKVRRNLGSGDWLFTNKEYWNLLLSAKWTLVLDFAVICHV